jgi:hypothetical protein
MCVASWCVRAHAQPPRPQARTPARHASVSRSHAHSHALPHGHAPLPHVCVCICVCVCGCVCVCVCGHACPSRDCRLLTSKLVQGGGRCSNNEERTLNITMLCDMTAGVGTPEIPPSGIVETRKCAYELQVRFAVLCPDLGFRV